MDSLLHTPRSNGDVQKPAPAAPAAVTQPQEPPAPVTTANVAPAAPPASVAPVPVVTQTPPPDVIPTDGGTPANTVVISDDTVLVDKEGNSYAFGELKASQYRKQNHDRSMRELSDQRKQLDAAATKLNKDAADPFVADYINFKRTHPELSETDVRAAIGRLYGLSAPQNAPAPVDPGPPKFTPPDGKVPGETEYDEAHTAWLGASMEYFSNKAAEKAVKPVLEINDAQKRERDTQAQRQSESDRILDANKEILNQYPHFVDFDVDKLSQDDRNEFFGRIRDVAQQVYGVAFTDQAMRSMDPERFLDKYELIVTKSWPEGTRPGKTPNAGLSAADIVSQHLNSGIGLVPAAQPKPPLGTPVPQSQNQSPPKKPTRSGRDPAKMDRLLHGEKTT